MSLIR